MVQFLISGFCRKATKKRSPHTASPRVEAVVFLPCGTCMIRPSLPCLCPTEDLSERTTSDHHSEEQGTLAKICIQRRALTGFRCFSAEWCTVHQSEVHSHTFPTISYRPKPLGGKDITCYEERNKSETERVLRLDLQVITSVLTAFAGGLVQRAKKPVLHGFRIGTLRALLTDSIKIGF